MEPGLDGPGRDIEDLGHVHEGQVEVEVQDDDHPAVDVETIELASESITLGDLDRGVRSSRRRRFRRHTQLEQRAALVRARHLVAGAHGRAVEPGIPGVRVTDRANVTPGLHQGILDRVLGTIGVAQDEAGDAIQSRERRFHQLREGFVVPLPGPFDERSLHGRHRFGAGQVPALSQCMSPLVAQTVPVTAGSLALTRLATLPDRKRNLATDIAPLRCDYAPDEALKTQEAVGGTTCTPMDVDLVVRAQQGDQQAFASIARSIAIRLRKMAYGVLRDMDLAEEAAQRAIIAIWRELPGLRDPGRFDAWAYRVLVHICYDERRRFQKHAATSLDGVTMVSSGSDIVHDVHLRDQLERGFERLSLEHRAVIVLHHQLGLPLDEVAEALEIPTGTVKSRLHRAMGQLRASLEADLRRPSPLPASSEAIR